eukprot:365161-Chlamydomonas_euryale.AAC.2
MVHVPIENQHTPHGAAGMRERGARGDGAVVVEAKAHCSRAFCMVARRAHHCQRRAYRAGQHLRGVDERVCESHAVFCHYRSVRA